MELSRGLQDSVQDIRKNIQGAVSLKDDEKAALEKGVIGLVAQTAEAIAAYKTDHTFYRIIVSALGVAILLIVVVITILLLHDKEGFNSLIAIGSAAVGGLVGLFEPSPTARKK